MSRKHHVDRKQLYFSFLFLSYFIFYEYKRSLISIEMVIKLEKTRIKF